MLAFDRLGWSLQRQNGGHFVLAKPGHMATVTVPDTRRVARGCLRRLIRLADLTVNEFAAQA